MRSDRSLNSFFVRAVALVGGAFEVPHEFDELLPLSGEEGDESFVEGGKEEKADRGDVITAILRSLRMDMLVRMKISTTMSFFP